MIRSRSIGLPPASFPGLRRGDSAKSSILSNDRLGDLLDRFAPKNVCPDDLRNLDRELGYGNRTTPKACRYFSRVRPVHLGPRRLTFSQEPVNTADSILLFRGHGIQGGLGDEVGGFALPRSLRDEISNFPLWNGRSPGGFGRSLGDEIRNIRLAHGKSPGFFVREKRIQCHLDL